MSRHQRETPPSSPSLQPSPEPHGDLLQAVGRGLVGVAPEDWYRLDLKYLATATVGQPVLTVLKQDRTRLTVRVPHEVEHALRELRGRMYEPGRGTWFALRFTVDPPMEYRVLFDHDHDPNWWPALPASEWRSDLEVYPRDPEHVPDWLREKLIEPTGGY